MRHFNKVLCEYIQSIIDYAIGIGYASAKANAMQEPSVARCQVLRLLRQQEIVGHITGQLTPL